MIYFSKTLINQDCTHNSNIIIDNIQCSHFLSSQIDQASLLLCKSKGIWILDLSRKESSLTLGLACNSRGIGKACIWGDYCTQYHVISFPRKHSPLSDNPVRCNLNNSSPFPLTNTYRSSLKSESSLQKFPI